MNILIKYPTRGRPQLFLKTLAGWLDHADAPSKIKVLVNYDIDDRTMPYSVISEAERMHPGLIAVKRNNASKVEACNVDLDIYQGDWEVVLLVSDDMFCCAKGWDTKISEHMEKSFPDTDGALWFFDGKQAVYNSIECVGRRRYESLGYLYHPSYKGFYCDFENTDVGLRDGKLIYVDESICTHENPCVNGSLVFDDTYARSVPWVEIDKANYLNRKLADFPK